MKICILLSGLQRNFEPFIENQINLVINKYNLDVFIYTCDENVVRFSNEETIDYIKKENYNNDENFFKNKYKNLKSIFIDYNNLKFNEFIDKNNIVKHKNHTVNMIISYFKINECIKLMEDYEVINNIKYDIVMRCRLDFFAFNNFLNPYEVNTNIIYLPISYYNNHKDDGGFIMSRNNIDYFKNFIYEIINYNDEFYTINIEHELIYYLEKHFEVYFTSDFCYRIGVGCKINEIPFINNNFKDNLYSIEYKNELN